MLLYLARIASAALLTIAIFLLMRFLINPQNLPALEESAEVDIRITRDKREEKTERRERQLPQQPKETPPPRPPPRQEQVVTLEPAAEGYHYSWSEWKTDAGQQMPMSRDRRAMPVVRIPPHYPQRALRLGIEGWVLLEFTINAAGDVEGVRVVDSEPPDTFDRESIRAIQGWKYQPKVVNGRPIKQPGMREIIVFELKD